MIEENNQRALLAWISSVQKRKFVSFRDLWDGTDFYNLLKKIDNFNITEFKEYDEEQREWTFVLANLNKLYKDLANYYRYNLQKISFDNNFANMLQVAQNKDSEQIYNFTLQVFGAAVQAKNKEIFILPIMDLQSDTQQTLKGLIQKFKFGLGDQSVLRQDDSSSQKKMLLAKVESLEVENQKLQKQIEAVLRTRKDSQQKYKRLEEQYKKLRQQYQNKLFELDNQPVSEIKVSAHMEELNAVLLQQLKAKLLEQTVLYNRQKAQMQDTIDFLKEKIQKKEQQLQNPDRNGNPIAINPTPPADHYACISLQKHQQLILAQSNKIKQIMKKEMDSSIQNINLKKEIQGLNREVDKMKNQFIKKSDAINRDDYDSVKLNVLQLLRDKFKSEAQKLQKV